MEKIRISESQIVAILKQADGGAPVPELCSAHGMSPALFSAGAGGTVAWTRPRSLA